jgi:predicted extracellular nuclease
VAGDLNDYRGQPAIHRIRGLDDIFDDLIQTGNVKYFEETELDTRWTYEYQGVRHQIDHILLSYSIKNICKKSGGIKTSVFEHNNHLASDHRPFIVILNFKN